ncbi:MAG TPA: AIR synthase-related protein, partial [Actinomycetota bacterium]|nr:AIR synthase-related protein [Actinomycetota bacterium]
ARRDLSYEIDRLPDVPEVLSFLVDAADLDPSAAYGTFNMGAGFAIFCPESAASAVVEAAGAVRIDAMVAGRVRAGPRAVHVAPVDVTFSGEQLELR